MKYEEYYISFGTKQEKAEKEHPFVIAVREFADSVKTALIIAAVLFICVFRTVGVEGASMEPSLRSGDRLIITASCSNPDYGDIIVITQPWQRNVPIIKRVIGLGGDVIDIDIVAGKVFRNGEELDEPYLLNGTYLLYKSVSHFEVPDGCCFVMGDNRNNSLDSRSEDIGFIERDYIMGKAVFRLFPLGKWKIEA